MKNTAQRIQSTKEMTKRVKNNLSLYFMVTPGLVFFFVLSYIPMLYLLIAFQNYNVGAGLWGSEFVGFENFLRFFSNKMFPVLLRNTLTLNVAKIAFNFAMPVLLALLMNELANGPFKKTAQSISYLPHFLSWIVVYGIMTSMFSVNGGLVNKLLSDMGFRTINLLSTPQYFQPFLIISEIWKESGWSSIIYIAALAGIPPDQYEAAKIDGASKLRQIWHVTLPGIRGTMIVLFILSCGSVLSGSFEQVMVAINPAVYMVGEIIPTYVYTKGMAELQLSYAAAVGLFQSVISFGLVFIANKMSARWGGESLW